MQDKNVGQFLELIPIPVFEIARILHTHGYKAYLVGGSIRDILLGRPVHDFDIATDAIPDTLLDLFPKSIEVGVKFGTVIILSSFLGLDDGTAQQEEFQVTTFRTDGEYINGRWPESVTFALSIEDDLSRRDFTINAFAIDLIVFDRIRSNSNADSDILGEPLVNYIVDNFNGLHDLEHGIIKTVGDSHTRMREDNLRAIRACRFASQLSFTIEHETFQAVCDASSSIEQISKERIRDEFIKILYSPTPSIGIELLRRSGILEKIIPELIEGVGMEQNQYHIHDIYNHLLRTCDVADRSIRLAALFHDIGKSRTKDGEHFYGHEEVGAKMTEEILIKLKFPRADILHTVKLIRLHMFNYAPDWSDGAVRRFMARVGDDNTLKDLFLLRIADSTANPKNEYDPTELKEIEKRIQKVREEDNALSLKDLKIDGNDLKELGVAPGKDMGRILNELLERVLDEPSLNEKDKLLVITKEIQNTL